MSTRNEARKLIALRLKPSMHLQAKVAAARAGVPLGQWIEEAINRSSAVPGMSLLPKISPKLIPYFEHFVHTANKTGLHPLDWGRYYNFIANAHRLQSKLTERDVKRLLVNEGFDDERAFILADLYRHGRDIIKVHQGSVPHGADDRWVNCGTGDGGQA